jgi:hypothetical protein
MTSSVTTNPHVAINTQPASQTNLDKKTELRISNAKTFFSKVWNVVKWIFKAIALAALFLLNPGFFIIGLAGGFITGAVFGQKARETANKVVQRWKDQKWYIKAPLIALSFLALPATLAAASFLAPTYLGIQLTKKSGEDPHSQ